MWKAFRNFWRRTAPFRIAIGAVVLVVGVLVLPGRFREACEQWCDLMPSQTTLLIALVLALLSYVIWIDVRPSILALWSRRHPQPLLYAGWDRVDPLRLADAACLWAGTQHVGYDVPPQALPRLRDLQNAIITGHLKTVPRGGLMEKHAEKMRKIDGSLPNHDPDERVTRGELIRFFESRNEHPAFAFPDRRISLSQHDVWATDALHYITSGEWPHHHNTPEVQLSQLAPLNDALPKLDQKVIDGSVTLWGREDLEVDRYVPIDRSHWVDFQMERYWWGIQREKFNSELIPGRPMGGHRYYALKATKSEIERQDW